MAQAFCEIVENSDGCLRHGDVVLTFGDGTKMLICDYHGAKIAEAMAARGLDFESSLIPVLGHKNKIADLRAKIQP